MSVVEEVRRYAVRHYGNLISVAEPEFDDRTKTWLAELKSDYPRIIHDDRRPKERIVKFLSLRRLGVIKFGDDLKFIEATPRESCVKNLSSFLELWQERAERIIVRASSDHLARINETQTVLSKVSMIISNLLLKEMISKEEIAFTSPKGKHMIRLNLRLLEGLDLVRRVEDGYTYGNLFTELLRQTGGDFQKFKIAVLSHVIRERYSTLKETLGISQLETIVHIDSCYYRPALEAENLLYWTSDSIINRYKKLYGRLSPLRIAHILGELVNVKALECEDKYYFGNEELFNQMLGLKSEMAELAPPRA